MHSLDISQQWLFGHGSQRPHFSSTDKGRQFYCLKVILPNLYWLHFLSFLDLTTRSVLVSFPLDGLSAYVFTTPRLSHFHCSLRRRLIPHRHSYFCNGAWSAIISPSHASVSLRRSAERRLSFSPWRHLGLLCPVSVFTCRQKTSKPQKNAFGWQLQPLLPINTCDSMGVNVPTVEMITMELVQAYIARGVLVSLLCQSKNSEVLNTFHPNSGGGLTMPLEKVWRNTWCVNSSGWLYCRSLCACDAIVMPGGHKDRGVPGIIYWGPSTGTVLLYVWSDPRMAIYLFTAGKLQ